MIAKRSEAQIQASRENGAKSRGPKTAEGKKRSRWNSFKHGILSRHFAPYGVTESKDELFGSILAELETEFKPRTATERRIVELLAADYRHIALIAELRSQIVEPGHTVGLPTRRPSSMVYNRCSMIAQLAKASDRNYQGIPRDIDLADIPDRLAEIVGWIERGDLKANVVAEYQPDECCEAAAAAYAKCSISALGLADPLVAAQYLRADAILAPEHLDAWQALLWAVYEAIARRRTRLNPGETPEFFTDQIRSSTCLIDLDPSTNSEEWFARFDQLNLLLRYETTIRGRIERATAQLFSIRQIRENRRAAKRKLIDQAE